MPKERNWDVPVDLPERLEAQVWEPVDRGAAQQKLLDCEAIMDAMGGGVIAAPVRVEVNPGRWITVGYRFSLQSFMPGTSISYEEWAGQEPSENGAEPEVVEAG